MKKKYVVNINLENKRVRKGSADEKVNETVSKKKQDNKKTKKKRNNPNDVNNQEINDIEDIEESINIVNKHNEKASKEREKRIGKTLKEIEEEIEEENQSKYINIKPIIFSILAVIILVVVYVIFTYGPIMGISITGKDEIKEAKIDFVTTENDYFDTYCDDLLVYSNQSITTYNKNGTKTWEYKLDQMFTPNIYINGKYMVLSNNSNGYIYLFYNKKEILNKKIEGNINNIYLDENGNMAVEYASSGYKKIVGVYDKSGENLYNTYLENEAIADIKLLDSAKQMLVVKLNATSFKVGIKIDIIDGSKSDNNVKELAKIDNCMMYDLTIEGSNIIILLDSKLASIDMNTGKVTDIKNFDSSQILFFEINKNYYTSVEKELNQEKDMYNINNVRYDGTVISTTNISNLPKMMKNSGYLNYFIYQDEYNIINKWAIELKKVNISQVPKEVIILNKEKSIALIYTNKIIIYTI